MATASEPTGVLRDPLQSQRVGFIELIFDVVFVFAFTQISQRLASDLTWSGLYKAVVLLLTMWWIWYRLAWTTNRYNPDRPAIQLMIVITMLATLLMSAALLHPFSRRELSVVFASTYVAFEVGRHVWLVLLGGNRHAQLVSVRVLFWATLSAPLWIAGIFTVPTELAGVCPGLPAAPNGVGLPGCPPVSVWAVRSCAWLAAGGPWGWRVSWVRAWSSE